MSPVHCWLPLHNIGFIISMKINNLANCKVQLVIEFFNERGHNAAEIYRQLCETYESTAMSEGKVRQWWCKFSEGHSQRTKEWKV